MTVLSFGFFSDIINAVNEAITVSERIKGIISDFRHAQEKNKQKESLERLKHVIYKIQNAFSEIHAELIIVEQRKQEIEYFKKNKKKLVETFSDILDTCDSLLEIDNLDYMEDYPVLREKLHIKVGTEKALRPVDDEEKPDWSTFEEFKKDIELNENSAREALLALVDHIRTNLC